MFAFEFTVFFELDASRRVATVLDCYVTRDARQATLAALGAFHNDLDPNLLLGHFPITLPSGLSFP